MRAPVAADGFMAPVGVDASGLGTVAAFGLPVAVDLDVSRAAAILRTRLIGLIRRVLLQNGSRLGTNRRQSGLANGECKCGSRQQCP